MTRATCVRTAFPWALLGLLPIGCASGEAPAAAAAEAVAWSPDTAHIVFSARGDDSADIYSSRDGAPPVRLTTDPAQDNYPRLSPDGAWIAFQSRRNGADDLYVMRADGSGVRRLTDDSGYDVLPAWSPDGTRIAFLSTRGFELGQDGVPFPAHVFVVNVDGTNLRQVSRERLTSSLGPGSWTPDGRAVTISRQVDGQLDVFLLDVATGDERRITSDPANEYGAAVSPDGAWVAFHAESDGQARVAVVNLADGHRRVLTPGSGRWYGPRWSPDGAWLLVTAAGPGEQYDLAAIEVESGTVRAIRATADDEREGDWR